MDATDILPYRTDVDLIDEWLEGRARGRSAARLRAAGTSTKAVEGAAATSTALGLTDAQTGELSDVGRAYVLAPPQERRALLREAMLRYPPYRDVMCAVAESGTKRVTEIPWLETWWGAHGYGNSPSNRREGAAVFGKLVEHTGLGRYVAGRRGHATRIEWEAGALGAALGTAAAGAAREPGNQEGGKNSSTPPPAPPGPVTEATAPQGPDRSDANRVRIPLAGGREARLEVPALLPAAEKRRLLALLDLLITATPDPGD